ncbi:MAG: amidase family protein [Microthrixaceae bacterium]|nr:amidase family protein [Microthrixaceae bacterium]
MAEQPTVGRSIAGTIRRSWRSEERAHEGSHLDVGHRDGRRGARGRTVADRNRRGDDHPDRRGRPDIGAVVHHDADQVRNDAAALAAELASSGPRGPLHGVPYVIKDLDDVAGVPTSYGLPMLRDAVATKSSVVASRMAAAGGLFVGKSNTPELGYQGVTLSRLR